MRVHPFSESPPALPFVSDESETGRVAARLAPSHGLLQRAMRRVLTPSFPDLLFISLISSLFLLGSGWGTLLADADTGWHIRTGEYILDNRRLPERDLFSFSRQDQTWYAWEWLADLVFALLFRLSGFKGIVVFAGTMACLSAVLVFRHMLWRKTPPILAAIVSLLGAGASTVHYLARPHIFTLVLMPASMWVLERDRKQPTWAVWMLLPLAALWANLHAGFVALPASLAIISLGTAAEAWWFGSRAHWRAAGRYTTLLFACVVSSALNPYGFRLHLHIAQYLSSEWIRSAVHEFQAPTFRSESGLHFEILLFAGVVTAGLILRTGRFADSALILAWAHAALTSVRHVPVFAAVACPIAAAEIGPLCAGVWHRVAGRAEGSSPRRHTQSFNAGVSTWPLAFLAALWIVPGVSDWPKNFPKARFPVEMVELNSAALAGARVFTSDQWGDYLLFRFYPRQRVFIDGRSDFYGPEIGKAYLDVVNARPGWEAVLLRYSIQYLLLPREWPLASLLERDPGWHVRGRDRISVLLERRPPVPRSTGAAVPGRCP